MITKEAKTRKRIIDYRIVNEIKRLRTEVCPNMGKDKVEEYTITDKRFITMAK